MPKIAAETVAKHRELIRGALVDAAEAILRSGEPLTAGVVSAAAGIARNSIYRYVDSVDDLRGLVLARYLPAWDRAVAEALAPIEDPGERVVEWVRANLHQATTTGHAWLMQVARDTPRSSAPSEVADQAHRIMRDSLSGAWLGLVGDPTSARIEAALTGALVDAAFQRLSSPLPTDQLTASTVRAARAQVEAVRRELPSAQQRSAAAR